MKIGHVNTGELLSLAFPRKADSLLQQFQEVLKKNGEDYQQELESKAKNLTEDSSEIDMRVVKEAERKSTGPLHKGGQLQPGSATAIRSEGGILSACFKKRTLKDLIQQVAGRKWLYALFNREALLVVPASYTVLPLIKKWNLNLK